MLVALEEPIHASQKFDKPQHLPTGNLWLEFNLGVSHMVGAGSKSFPEGKLTVWRAWKDQTTWTALRWYSWYAKGRWDLPRLLKTKWKQGDDSVSFQASLQHLSFVKPSLSFRISASEDGPLQQYLENGREKHHLPLYTLHLNNGNNIPVLTSSCPLPCLPNPKAFDKLFQRRARFPKYDSIKISEV